MAKKAKNTKGYDRSCAGIKPLAVKKLLKGTKKNAKEK